MNAPVRKIQSQPARKPDAPVKVDPRERLRRAIDRGAKYLPVQWALEVFVHLNLLTAFQHLPFDEALRQAEGKLRCRGYLPKERYRAELARGRIRDEDIEAVLADEALSQDPIVPGFPTHAWATRLVLRYGVGVETPAHLRWILVERDAANRFGDDVPEPSRAALIRDTRAWLEGQLAGAGPGGALEIARLIVSPTPGVRSQGPFAKLGALLGQRVDDLRAAFEADPELLSVRALWTACIQACEHLEGTPAKGAAPPRFFRDWLHTTGGDDPVAPVHDTLIPLCGAFLDRGLSHWPMPDRNRGFFRAWLEFSTSGLGVRPTWASGLDRRLADWKRRDVEAEDAIVEVLGELGVAADELDEFIEHTLLLLPGWAGMFARLTTAPSPLGRSPAKVRLVDFLAVRLTLDLLAYREFARRLGHRGPVAELREFCRGLPPLADPKVRGRHDTAWPLFRLCQLSGIAAPAVRALSRADVDTLLRFFDELDEHERCRLLHLAYEQHYYTEVLEGLAANMKDPPPAPPARPSFQTMLCLDDRFESSRRHLEEIDPDCETFGAAGFFGLAIAYQGIDDPGTFPLCPMIVSPQHRIEEQPLTRQFNVAELRAQRRRRLGKLEVAFNRASRSLLFGPFVTAAAGFAAALPLLANVFSPHVAARVRKTVERWWLPEPLTRLTALRAEAAGNAEAVMAGFTLDEMATRLAAFFNNTGFKSFSPIILALGHDSSSVNNPYFPAYSCAACGGRSGGPNGRLFARMANHPGIRNKLKEKGITIPDDTYFVGGIYDTSTDSIQFYDVEELPKSVQANLAEIAVKLEEMCKRNAHERSRRFESAPPGLSAPQALRHVERRAVDLSEARPELGHAGCASTLFGRRSRTRGLFMDRRCLLVSYDPDLDPEGALIEKILVNVSPVGAGISLDYYFSTVDPVRLGSDSKMPHNVTGLFGVMNGACSDLRTGLPRQATEMHEPVRNLVIIEATPERLTGIVQRQPSVAELVVNEWVKIVALDPNSDKMWTFDRRFGFRPFIPQNVPIRRVQSSLGAYGGRVGWLPPALIRPR
jgi:hypothetical protein